ncbi:MAG: heme lyase CcmF/NrfE family subunit, partial [Calditerrivibrio sp.]|nr:heme lyase CcmF/NrfE family subunit [Calditerrivibrio sp.]
MGKIGFLLQLFGLFAGFAAIFFYGSNLLNPKESNEKYGKLSIITQFVLITLSSIVLMIALVQSDFSIEYVAQYTDRSLPMIYKLSAYWAGQAGSLLFWGWLVSVFAFIEIFRIKNYSLEHKSGVFFIIALTSTFFLMLTNFVTNPFKTLDFIVSDGNGMNP